MANIDIAPTVYKAAGITPSYTVDGRDIMSSKRQAILIQGWADVREPHVPTWRGRWTPRDTYVRYHAGDDVTREYYGPNDPWQLTNVYGDGLVDNEPGSAARWDRWLRAAARCAGSECP